MNTISQTFDFGRFTKVLKHDIMSDSRAWMLKLLVMTGFTTLMLIMLSGPGIANDHPLISYANIQAEGDFAAFKFCGILFCAIGASMFMSNMSSGGQRLETLMVPASQTEKFLARWTICILGVTVAYLLCFCIADALRVIFIRLYVGDVPGLHWLGPWGAYQEAEKWYYPVIGLVSVQGWFMLGSTIWPQNSFRKTFGALILLAIASGFIFSMVLRWLMHNFTIVSGESLNVTYFETTFSAMFWINCAWIIFCYVVAWFRFRESEIIHRF